MNTFTKVLLASDLTPQSDNLLGCLTGLCPDTETEVVLAHVVDSDEDADPHGSTYKEIRNHLEGYEQKLKSKGYEAVTIATPAGEPEKVLNDLIEECEADLLMVASHGKGFFERTFKGSTTYEMAKNATIPLFIDRDDDNDNSDELLGTVMVATDFSKKSLEALNIIRELREFVGRVVFLHVVEHSRSREDFREQEAAAEMQLEELVDELKIFGIEADYIVEKGRASQKIDEVCEKENVGMVIMARTGTGISNNLALGGTAENVVLNVDRAILLLPAADMDD